MVAMVHSYESSVYNVFAFTVNLRLSAVAFIYFIEILVHRLQCIRGVGAVHVAFPGRFLLQLETLTERADKKIKSVPRVFLKTNKFL